MTSLKQSQGSGGVLFESGVRWSQGLAFLLYLELVESLHDVLHNIVFLSNLRRVIWRKGRKKRGRRKRGRRKRGWRKRGRRGRGRSMGRSRGTA